jgi:hypothetical protein
VCFALRKVRKSRWLLSEAEPWLAEGGVQADALRDMETDANRLSVWMIHDDESNLDQVLAALAANCDYVTNIDYVLFPLSYLDDLGIARTRKLGSTLDRTTNEWHVDLGCLSASQLASLTERIALARCCERRPKGEVLQVLVDAVCSHRIALDDLKDGVRMKVTPQVKDCLQNA